MHLRISFILIYLCSCISLCTGYPDPQRHFWQTVKPILDLHCSRPCHNADDNKGGLNLMAFDFIQEIQRRGEIWVKVIEHVQDGSMPPDTKPALTKMESDTILLYINKYIRSALEKPDPGLITSTRLSNHEYEYAIQDLTGITINADSLLPRDASGGEGFDNFAASHFVTPLLMERYFEVGETVIEELGSNKEQWRSIVPENSFSIVQRIRHLWYSWIYNRNLDYEETVDNARDPIVRFTTQAYRRYLKPDERQKLVSFFEEVYHDLPEDDFRYDEAIQEVFKVVLVSHNFLIRTEVDPPLTDPYPVSSFELASRLSFFLWCSIPDNQLLEAAYKEDLHNPELYRAQVQRMLKDPKARRMAESFSAQWLEVDNLNDPSFEIDKNLFPEFDEELKSAMHDETVEYFYYTLSESRNFLELLNGRYTFLNEKLANHYGIEGVKGKEMRRVELETPERGGILGMASVLTTTSLPNRTSPVLRGKWVMEKVLATPPKPPPPNVPDLEATKQVHDELTLREALVLHRENPACYSCHQDMDDLGFALENYDALGRWRTTYTNSTKPIDVTGSLKSGEQFEGAVQLREILIAKQDQFATAISKKMLGFALGRSIEFKDTKTVESLAKVLIENNFDPVIFIEELTLSYPFQYKKSDPVVIVQMAGT